MNYIKDFYKKSVLEQIPLANLPKDKEQLRYFFDKTIIISWVEGNKKSDINTKVFLDLIGFIKGKVDGFNALIPIDVLLELKDNDNKKYISNKKFIKVLESLCSIKEVDPSKKFKHHESVIKLSEQYKKAKYSCMIITMNKGLYRGIDKKIWVMEPSETLSLIISLYSVFPEYGEILNDWIKKIK